MSAKMKYYSLPKRKRHFPITVFSRLIIGLFSLGFLTGCFCGTLLKNQLYEPVLTLFQSTVNNLPYFEISYKNVFFYSLKDNLKVFLLFAFFSMTNVWKLYYTGFTLYTGFSQGLLFSFCLLLSSTLGILQYLCFLLPHALLLIPVFLIAVARLDEFHSGLFTPENGDTTGNIFTNNQKRQLFFTMLPLFLIGILLLTFCSLLEGYLNIPLLKYFHSKFI